MPKGVEQPKAKVMKPKKGKDYSAPIGVLKVHIDDLVRIMSLLPDKARVNICLQETKVCKAAINVLKRAEKIKRPLRKKKYQIKKRLALLAKKEKK